MPNDAIVEGEDGLKYVVRKKVETYSKVLVKVVKRNDKYSIIEAYTADELAAIGIDVSTYSKMSQYDSILMYPDLSKLK